MVRSWEKAAAAFLVLVLLVPLSFGCGAEKEGGKVTITIGEITDLTGPASPAVITLHYALQDMVKYYNEEGLIPGVKLDTATWDDMFNPSRDMLGYDWVRERGAKLIVSVFSASGVQLKAFADRDKFPICNLSTNVAMTTPPGWVFCMSNGLGADMKTLLKWISENHWDYAKGIPKIGFEGGEDPGNREVAEAMQEYSQAHPDRFEYVGSCFYTIGQTLVVGGEAEKLRQCDYIASEGILTGPFIEEFQRRGYSTTFIDVGQLTNYRGLLVDRLGYKALDGLLTGNSSLGWNDNSPIVNLAKQLLNKYRHEQANAIIYKSLSYVGGTQNVACILEILRNAITQVGAQNFNSQAFYDAAVNYKTGGPLFEGYPQWSFSETKRYLVDQIVVSKFSAEANDVVRVSDWIPLVIE